MRLNKDKEEWHIKFPSGCKSQLTIRPIDNELKSVVSLNETETILGTTLVVAICKVKT